VSGRWFRVGIPTPSTIRGRRRWVIPKCPGTYALYEDGELVYIGSSVNLLDRVRAHINSGRWDPWRLTAKVSPMASGWAQRERQLVDRLQPRDNRQWNRAHVIEQRRFYPDGRGEWMRCTRREWIAFLSESR
jgi:hypothetical protein